MNIAYIIYIRAYLDAVVFLCEPFCIFLKESERNEKGDVFYSKRKMFVFFPLIHNLHSIHYCTHCACLHEHVCTTYVC